MAFYLKSPTTELTVVEDFNRTLVNVGRALYENRFYLQILTIRVIKFVIIKHLYAIFSVFFIYHEPN